MESVKPSALTPAKSKLRRTFAKVLHVHKLTGIVPEDGVQELKSQEKVKKWDQDFGKDANFSKYDQDFGKNGNISRSFDKLKEEFEKRQALESLIAKIFASISSLKAAYAQLQHAQSPYDAEGIQKSDESIVFELKVLSGLKQCFLKKQFDPSPERTMVLAEIQELRSLLKTYEITGKKLESQLKLKDSEIIFLREKLKEANKHNRIMEKRLNRSGQLKVIENLHISGLNHSHFIAFLRQTVKSIRSFNKLMIEEMKLAGWDLDVAAESIQPGTVYYKPDHKCFAFEHFIFREMFDSFHLPNFCVSHDKKKQRQVFFDRFTEMKSVRAKEFLSTRPKSTFARFVCAKYLQLIHPKMESLFFDNLHQRNQVMAGEFPDTNFFASFIEMAKRVWVLHSLAFSFEPEASVFQAAKGCRFSEVYMKSVADEAFFLEDSEPHVSFTIVPGFRIGKTIIQCEVYLSHS